MQELIGLAAASKLFGQTGRSGTAVHPATLTRWILRGVRGRDGSTRKLRAVRVGSRWATCCEWVKDFIGATTAARVPVGDVADVMRSPARRDRETAAAMAELETRGVRNARRVAPRGCSETATSTVTQR